MGKGIQIKKPDHLSTGEGVAPLAPAVTQNLPAPFLIMMVLTFPAAFLALYFFFQTRHA